MTTVRTVLLDEAERQRVFRACLDALAQPGTVRQLGVDRHEAVRLPLLALTDLMTPVAALSAEPGVRDAIAEVAGLTRAPLAEVADARWLLAGADLSADLVRTIPLGTDQEPHLGATVVVPADLDEGAPAHRILGPGIADERIVHVSLSPEVVAARAERLVDYPRGFDLLCVSADGRVLGLPRTTAMAPIARHTEGAAR